MDKENKVIIEFEKYLESIGGLVDGYNSNRDNIKSRYFFNVGDGWLPLIKKLIQDCIDLGWDKQICQVKEKFGGLRFYINSAETEVFKLISKAENDSYSICEECGVPGTPNKKGWIKTLCEKHKEQ